MFFIALVLLLVTVAPTSSWQTERLPNPTEEAHVREVLKELPPNSVLRNELLHGARGDGIHHPWMDAMRREGIKRAIITVNIDFDRHGRPKRMNVGHVEFFTDYEGIGTPIADTQRLHSIQISGLENQLENLALTRAALGRWVDVPRPTPEPFVGGAKIEFLDDEWLPVLYAPIYCSGKAC
jgi:hypothetical protein